MTVVDHDTGEVLATLTPEEARGLTHRIRTGLDDLWQLVGRAYTEQAWKSLGYASWNDYTAAEFRGVKLALPREERLSVLRSLQDKGMSGKAIAAATGLSTGTVSETLNPPDRSKMNGTSVHSDAPEIDEGDSTDRLSVESPSSEPIAPAGVTEGVADSFPSSEPVAPSVEEALEAFAPDPDADARSYVRRWQALANVEPFTQFSPERLAECAYVDQFLDEQVLRLVSVLADFAEKYEKARKPGLHVIAGGQS